MGLSARVSVWGWGWGGLYVEINECQEERMKKSLIFFIETLFTSNVFAGAYSEPCHTSKIVNGVNSYLRNSTAFINLNYFSIYLFALKLT